MMKHFDRTIINVILPREEGFREGIGQRISWGTEIMARLLRVSRHVHDEAEEVLYKEFNLGQADTTSPFIVSWLQELCPTSATYIHESSWTLATVF